MHTHQVNPLTTSEAAAIGHSQCGIWVLVYGSDDDLPVHGRPLHHTVIHTTVKVKGHAKVCSRVSISAIGVDGEPVRVAFRVVEAATANADPDCCGGQKAAELADLPHGDGTCRLCQGDVVDGDAAGCLVFDAHHTLKKVAELISDAQGHVSNLPRIIPVT